MCLAVPAEVVELLDGDRATVDTGGVRDVVLTGLVDGLRVGDYVIVHLGHALSRIDREEAQKTLELFGQIFAVRDGAGG